MCHRSSVAPTTLSESGVPGCQDIIVDYATTMAHIAMDQATGRGGKLQPEDFLYLVRKASMMTI